MRLEKITIGSEKDGPSHQFKNLKNVTVDFDQDHWATVVIGWNGTGKSNVLEALATIFRDLIAKLKSPAFAFKLAYRMGSGDETLHIHIDADPDRSDDPYMIHVATERQVKDVRTPTSDGGSQNSTPIGERLKLAAFFAGEGKYLPRYVFSYYAGESHRMRDVFRPYLESYDKKLRNGDDPGPKRLFYALPVHSQFVLLAFLINQTESVKKFLVDHLRVDPIESIESVLFVLRQPPWTSRASDGDPRFWNARGVVSNFLGRLFDVAIAPITVKRRVPVSLWNDKTLEFKYLYVKDVDGLRELVGVKSPAEFFRDLESTYVSELIDEVRIRIRVGHKDGSLTFRELSEGERQLLTVLGLIRFTAEDESLFLLDEPDTHLNPRWCVDYIKYLKVFAHENGGNENNSHAVLTTHNPLAIAELMKGQVQILHNGNCGTRVAATHPSTDPRGMGFAGIVTSDMFGLGSSLDAATNQDLIELHRLSTKDHLSDEERATLATIRHRLAGLDFNFASRDRLEQEFLRARYDLTSDAIDGPPVTPENKRLALEALVKSLLNEARTGER